MIQTRPCSDTSVSCENVESIDVELARLARSAGALHLALGVGLECLARRGGHHELGFSSLKAYARERCEYSARAAEEARSLARRLELLPQTRAALLSGQLNRSLAVLIARVATAKDEARWLELARAHTVRQMRGFVRAHRSAGAQNNPVDCEHGLEGESERFRLLTVTVDAADAWLFECARWMVARISGGISDDAVLEAILAEGETSLLPLTPRECITEIEADPAHIAQRAWEAERARWRQEAELCCEARFSERHAPAACPVIHVPGVDAMHTQSIEALDAWLRKSANELAQRDIELGRLAERFWKANGWRRLGYATETQYATERLGVCSASVKDKRKLARALDASPDIGRALSCGKLGSEAARLIVQVATVETVSDWITRAGERTVKHLREDVAAAELVARLTDATIEPPSEGLVKAVQKLESMVVSGAAFATQTSLEQANYPTDGQMSAAHAAQSGALEQSAGQMSAAHAAQSGAPEQSAGQRPASAGDAQDDIGDGFSSVEAAKALATLLHAFDETRRPSNKTRSLARVTFRLRVREDTYWQYRSRERLHRRFGPQGSFLRFLCLSLIGAWKHTLRTGVAYEHIYVRERFQCASPVCWARSLTPHHLRFRAHGGSDSDENVLGLCVWCHLEGIHGHRLEARPPASAVHWVIGRTAHTVVHGRRRIRFQGAA